MDSKIINWCFGRIGRDNEFVTFSSWFVSCIRKTSKASQGNISALKFLKFEIPFLARVGVYDVQNRFWLVEIRDMRVLKHASLR